MIQPFSDIAFWRPLLAPFRWHIVLLLACQLGQAVASLLLPWLSADLIDNGILRNDGAAIWLEAGLMLLAVLVQVALGALVAWLGARVALGFGAELRSRVYAHVQQLSLAELRTLGTPSLITRTTNDVQQLQSMLAMVLTMVAMAPIMGLGAVVMALRLDVPLSMVLLAAVPVLGLVVGLIVGRSLPLFARMQMQIDQVNLVLREQISGVRTIRAFVRDAAERARFGAVNDGLTDTATRVGRLMALNMPAAMAVMQLTSVAMVWFGAYRIAAGAMQAGGLVAFISYIAQVLISVMIASMLFAFAPRALVSARRVREVLQTRPSVAEPRQPREPEAGALGTVEFRNVSFAYPGAAAPVLQGVSFRMEPGQTLAVIGPTGAGKSTIVNLVARFFDVTAGQVLVNGVDVREQRLERLWSSIGLVPQESYLFSGTVAQNLRYGRPEASDDALWQALGVAQARDFVAELPEGLAAPVAQGGDNFSGGQRQRLTIARALVRQPAIYLFDDSFSALDYVTDARLRHALAAETGRASSLVVGQRVSSLRHADCILVIDKGSVIGRGTHDELLHTCAAYREIVASQDLLEDAA